ncbi:MAG: hypothetical protein WKF47_08990 [Geodermatophilaceae bacterium]
MSRLSARNVWLLALAQRVAMDGGSEVVSATVGVAALKRPPYGYTGTLARWASPRNSVPMAFRRAPGSNVAMASRTIGSRRTLEGQVCFAAGLVNTALEDLEDQGGGFFPQLADEDLQALERWCLQRVEPVTLEHPRDGVERRLAPTYVVGQEVAGA